MTKEELLTKIAEDTGLPKTNINAVIKSMITHIRASEKTVLVGFGTFKWVTQAAREARNPSNGKTIQVPEKTVLKFKASK